MITTRPVSLEDVSLLKSKLAGHYGDVELLPTIDNSTFQNLTLQLQGLKCKNCIRKIKTRLESLPGIMYIQVDLATQKAVIGIDKMLISVDSIEKDVIELGYTVVQRQSPSTVISTIQLNGLTCQSCAKAIGDSIKSMDGILDINVDHQLQVARVTYDHQVVFLRDITEKIESLGYQVLKENEIEIVSGNMC